MRRREGEIYFNGTPSDSNTQAEQEDLQEDLKAESNSLRMQVSPTLSYH